MLRDFRLYCVFASSAFWLGGFAFYFGVVVPIGGAIVGGSEQGFVTQQVTHWLNLIGVVSMLFLAWNWATAKTRLQLATLVIVAICQIGLFVMHYYLDAMLDTKSRSVIEPTKFSTLHESYEAIATIQWVAGMVHLFGIVRCRK